MSLNEINKGLNGASVVKLMERAINLDRLSEAVIAGYTPLLFDDREEITKEMMDKLYECRDKLSCYKEVYCFGERLERINWIIDGLESRMEKHKI